MGESKTATPTPAPVATEAKRQRRKSAPKETKVAQDSPSSEENGVEWLPKGKNWDKDVKAVDTIVREDDEGLMAWLEFNNGHRAKVALQACYEKCPLKVCPARSQKLIRILIVLQSDAQVLRIPPVSQALPIEARNMILTSSIVSLRIIKLSYSASRKSDIPPSLN